MLVKLFDMSEFNEKFNYDDVMVRRMIGSLLMEMKNLMYFYQQVSETEIRKVDIPCLFSVTGQEQFLRDKFIYAYEGLDIAKLDYETVPRCVIQLENLAIETNKNTNKFVESKFKRMCNGVMRECSITTEFVPVSLTFKSTIVVSNVNELFKCIESVVSKLYHRIHAFTVDVGLFNVDAAIKPLESYTQTYPVEFASTTKKDFKIDFSMVMNTFMPCFENGVLIAEIDEALKNVRNPENDNGTVTFYRDSKGILKARLSSLLNIDINVDTQKSFVKKEVEQKIATPVVILYDDGCIYQGFTYTDSGGRNFMVNGKAKYGSKVNEPVWTVYYSQVSPIGEVLNTKIEENQIWSEIKKKYKII